jgi:16S rRNA processing protein RimM
VPADLVELGAVRGAYGVKGWARVQPFDAEATVLRAARRWWLQGKGQTASVEVTAVRRHGGLLLAKWQGWESPEAIDAVRGATVSVPRSEFPPLPAGEYYWSDLIGAEVINRDGVLLGQVQALANNGAHDLLQVAGSAGVLLVPLVPAYVDEVNVGARVIRVDWQTDWS